MTLRREILLIWISVGCIYLLTTRGYDDSEGKYHYAVARQILTRGELSFDHPMPGVFTVAPNGRTYASHEIGNALFQLPIAAVNVGLERRLAPRMKPEQLRFVTEFLRSLLGPLYCCTTVMLLYVCLRLIFAVPRKAAALGCLAFAFCTFYWEYINGLYDGIPCSLLLMAGVLCLFQFQRTGDLKLFIVSIASLGLGVITRLTMVLPLAGAGLYIVLFTKDRRRAARLALIGILILLPFAAWQLYYNHLRTGSYLVSPVQSEQYAVDNALDGPFLAGLAGLLFSPGKSVLVYCPLALLSLFCIPQFWRKFPREALFTIIVIVLWFLVHAKMRIWFAKWAWGPRHFVPVSPLLALPFAACSSAWLSKGRHKLLAALALAWGALLSICSVTGSWFFRMALATQQGRADQLLWSLTGNQAIDMIRGFGENLRHIMGTLPYENIPGMSPTNVYASNTISFWWNSAYYNHVPWYLLASAALALILASIMSFTILWCAGDAESGSKPGLKRLPFGTSSKSPGRTCPAPTSHPS